MVAALRRVMVCPPQHAGWTSPERAADWRELGYAASPDASVAAAQHAALWAQLEAAGAEVLVLPAAEDFSLDAVYGHDPSFLTDAGAVILRMGKSCRAAEPQRHAEFYRSQGIPILGAIEPPGTVEAGDLVWLDARTVLAGRGYRTNAAGIEQLRALLAPQGVEVLAAPLPHGPGPAGCLHLMSLLSLLDERTVLVDLPLLAVETMELLCSRGFTMLEIESAERDTLACNVLSLGNRRLLALEENAPTNARLRDAGFDVRTFPGSVVAINGGGGPTCLTRPVLRA